MVFAIDQQLLDQLQHLDHFEEQTLSQVCQVAFDSLKSGAEHLESLPNEDLKPLVKQTMSLIVQSVKFGLLDNELKDFLSSITSNDYYNNQLVTMYKLYKPSLSKVLLIYSSASSYQRHVKMQWKFEVKVASKHIREQLVPQIILRLQTKNSQNQAEVFSLQCSPADILYMVDKLGDALRRNSSNSSIGGKGGLQRIL